MSKAPVWFQLAVKGPKATVTVSVAPAVVLIPEPAAIVRVSPTAMSWLEPAEAAKVKRLEPPVRQLPQVGVLEPAESKH